MKTSFKAKIIIETGEYEQFSESNNQHKPYLTLQEIKNHINHKKIEIEFIDDSLTTNQEPTFIIKLI